MSFLFGFRHRCYFLISILCLIGSGLCAQTPVTGNTPALPKIRFGTLPAESAIPIIVARETGLFTKVGINVELQPFNSPLDRNIALQAGKLDGMIADVMTALSLNEAGLPMRITSDINEDFKLLCSPKSGITSFAALDKKDVSVVPNFALEYIMDRLAQKNGISYHLVSIPSIPARFEALLGDKISAVVFTEPQATLLAARGASVLAGSRENGLQAGAILFGASFIKEYPSAIKAFYQAYNQAVAAINATPPGQLVPILSRYGFPDAVKDYLGSGSKYQPAATIKALVFADILAWSKLKGLVKKDTSLAAISSQNLIP